jgi:enhancing lycopene biosynthesis protein 2
LLAIIRQGAKYQCFAPDIKQAHVVNHLTGKEMPETRNVLVEAARIARGNIKPLSEYHPDNFDAIVFPGGFGVAKNLCSFAFDGADCVVNKDAEKAIRSTVVAGKPVGALCISPVLIAKVLGDVEVTIGDEEGPANAIETMGGSHIKTTHGEIVYDSKYKVVTTPCYMLDATIDQIADGAENVIRKILELC